MTKPTPKSPLDVVTALMQERVKFEAWLEALDARRASTPKHVYDRVRKDYESRLTGVVDELKQHAAALEEQAEKYTARLARLAEQEQERRDARAEAELRAHVGELSDADWKTTAAEADEALAAIAAEQAVVGADLNRVHELLGAATAPPTPPAAEPRVAPAAEPVAEAAPSPRLMNPPAAPAAPARDHRTPEQSKFDELAFLKSVVAQPTPANGRAIGKAPDAPPAGGPRPGSRPADAEHGKRSSSAHEARHSHAAPKPRDEPPAPRVASPDITQAASETLGEALADHDFVREDPEDAAAGLIGRAREPERNDDRPFAANVTGNNPIVLRPAGAAEQPKTLKCVECGSMNYPTEWYCERCGAELASL